MIQKEFEKEEFIEYVESALSHIKEKIPDSLENLDLNNNDVKKTFLDLIRTIKDMRDKDRSFYDGLLNDIPELKFFNQEIEELNETKYFLSDSLSSPEHDTNAKNFAELMKSSKIYYFINKKTTKILTNEQLLDLGDLEEIKNYLEAIWPSAKQEELLGILLYINSGQATNDYNEYIANPNQGIKEQVLYNKFKASLHDLHVELNEEGNSFVEIQSHKDNNISTSNKMDAGVVLDKIKKKLYVGFATSKYDTSDQQKQYFEKLKALRDVTSHEDHPLFGYEIIPAYITNALLNENELLDGDREHKKEFLSLFSEKLTKEEKNKLNCLSFLSMAGNIKMPDINKGLDIKDFCLVNPYVSGADTLWIHKVFSDIKKLPDSQQYPQLRDFLINEVNEVLLILKAKLPDFQLTYLNNQFGDVFKNLEKMMKASMELFHEGNMDSKEVYNEKFIKKISEVAQLYKSIHKDKFNMAMPKDSSEMQGNTLYNNLKNPLLVKTILEEHNADVISILEDKERYKINLGEKAEKIKATFGNDVVTIAKHFSNHEVNIFKTEEKAIKCLEEILLVSQLNPSRNIRKALNSAAADTSFPYVKNLVQNAKYWERNKDSNKKNYTKNNIMELIIDNCENSQKLLQAVEKYSTQSHPISMENFKALATNPQRKRFYKELKGQKESTFNKNYKQFKEFYLDPHKLCWLTTNEREDRLVSYLKIKAELVVENNGNKNSLTSFDKLYSFVKEVGLQEDLDVKKCHEIAYDKPIISKKVRI